MTPSLKSVRVSNFRSICGEVLIPLDAPVVLIHGQNGTGKTSTLSAIELALTGGVESLARLDGEYTSHLVHKAADEARIQVAVEGEENIPVEAEMVVREAELVGRPLLSGSRARVFSERCYLAQSTVSRLLEMYESKESSTHDSPLTSFVKELLGLGELEALIEGLHIAGDIRRLRGPVPEYWHVRSAITDLEREVEAKKAESRELVNDMSVVRDRLRVKLDDVGVAVGESMTEERIAGVLGDDSEEPALRRLAHLRREIAAMKALWQKVDAPVTRALPASAERQAAQAASELREWRSSSGEVIQELFRRLTSRFPDLPSPEVKPETARQVATATVDVELQRCESVLARDVDCAAEIETLDTRIAKVRSRMAALDSQIGDDVGETDAWAKALAGLRSHISGDVCPVCARDYKEVSTDSLDSVVSRRITDLTEAAGRLQALMRERTSEERQLAIAERERDALAARRLSDEDREGLSRRKAELERMQAALREIGPAAEVGERAIAVSTAATRRVVELRSADQHNAMIRESVERFAAELEMEQELDTENLEATLSHLEDGLSDREEGLNARLAAKQSARSDLQDWSGLESRLTMLQEPILDGERRLVELKAAMRLADQRIEHSRELRRRARALRNGIMVRVFNETLNAVWRELFVRLAPDEPFVPAFALPSTQQESVEAVLETLYRSGGKGGNPRAMLSAGNLNTAALTLFLALHFTANPDLPWLIIDDPVQSMDEVHIAQLAALLRTISKQHGRQVIMAVHEKPLFDYLALELNPAFEDDRLITVELGRSAVGETWSQYKYVTWRRDPAIAA